MENVLLLQRRKKRKKHHLQDKNVHHFWKYNMRSTCGMQQEQGE